MKIASKKALITEALKHTVEVDEIIAKVIKERPSLNSKEEIRKIKIMISVMKSVTKEGKKIKPIKEVSKNFSSLKKNKKVAPKKESKEEIKRKELLEKIKTTYIKWNYANMKALQKEGVSQNDSFIIDASIQRETTLEKIIKMYPDYTEAINKVYKREEK